MNNDKKSNLFLKNVDLNCVERFKKKMISLRDIIHIYTSFQKLLLLLAHISLSFIYKFNKNQ